MRKKVLSILLALCMVLSLTPVASLATDQTPTCNKIEHTHTTACYQSQLICNLVESEQHQHTDSCYQNVLTCKVEAHTHGENCYTVQKPTEPAEPSAYEKVVALFSALPEVGIITPKTTDEVKATIMAQVQTAMDAYDALPENAQTLFDTEHNGLLIVARALNDALTSNTMVTLNALSVTLYVSNTAKDDKATRADNAEYKTLGGAIDAAASGDTIILNTDINESSVFITDKELTIDFNGHVLTLSSTSYGLDVDGTAKITLKDGSGNNSGGIKHSRTQVECILIEGAATVTIESGSYESNLGYCVKAASSSTGQVIINGGSFTSNSSCVYNDSSDARIFLNGGTFSGNINGANGGVLLTPEVLDKVYNVNHIYNNIYIHFPSGSNKLTKDLDLHDWQLRVLGGENTTIDLNGFNITGNGMMKAPSEGGSVIMVDMDNLSCLIQVHKTGTLTVGNSGQCNDTHGRIYNVNDDIRYTFRNFGNLILNGNLKVETLVGSEALTNGQNSCVYLNSLETTGEPSATLTVNEGVELHAEAVKDGTSAYAIMPSVGDEWHNGYAGATKVTINGGKFYGEKSTMQMSGTLEINGGTFTLSPETTTECLYIGYPTAQIVKIENAHFEGNSTGLWIGEQVSQSDDITLKNTTMNASSVKPIGTALEHQSNSRVVVSGKNTLWIANAIRGTQTGGILDIRAGVYSTDPSQYVLDANNDTIKDYAVLDYTNEKVKGYFLVAPWTEVGTDNKVSLYYPAGVADTVTASDDVSIVALNDTDSIIPDAKLVQPRHFTLSSDENKFTGIDGLSVTGFTNGNRLTVEKTKACNAEEAYVWYGGRNVGKIIIETKKDPTYDVGGEITGAIGKPTAYLIRDGKIYHATVAGTDNPYQYVVTGIPTGIYNLVVSSAPAAGEPTKNTITTTVLVAIINQSIAQNVVLPQKTYNSIVTTEGEKTPHVEAGGLDDMAKTVGASNVDNTYVLIELKVAENESSDHADAVRKAISDDGMVKGIIMDTDVLKTVNNATPVEITEINQSEHGVSLITAVFHLPKNLQGKEGYAIFRYHGNEVNKITETVNENGEYMEVNAKKDTITARLNKFSTYSIAYSEKHTVTTVTFDANGGSVTPTKAETNAENKLKSLPTPTRSGYSFDGWYTAADGGTKVTTDTVFTKDSTIYAHWTYNGGSPTIYYTITATADTGGTISPVGNVTVGLGESKSFTITANPDYAISDVKVDGVSKGAISTYTFTNITANHTIMATYEKIKGDLKGELTVSKTVTGGGNKNALFTFRFTFSEAGKYGYTGSKTGSISNGGRIQLKHGESVTITIPRGVTYTVVEDAATRYIPTPKSRTYTGTITATPVTANFENRYDEKYIPPEPTLTGSLKVKKTVKGDLGDKDKKFAFIVTFNADGQYRYIGSKSGVIESGDTLWLRHGEYVKILNLPEGTDYSVKERENSGYKVDASGETGVIVANDVSTAAFTNSRSGAPKTGDDNSLLGGMLTMFGGILGVATLLVLNGRKRRKNQGEGTVK